MKRVLLLALLTFSVSAQTPPVTTCSMTPPANDQLCVLLINSFGYTPLAAQAFVSAIQGVGVAANASNAILAAVQNQQTADETRITKLEANPPGTGPQGPAGTISVGAVMTGAPGSQAAVTNTGSPSAAMLNFTIPQGASGNAGTINVGSVLTGAPGSQATVTDSGTPTAAVLNFTIPQGAMGPPGPPGNGGTSISARPTFPGYTVPVMLPWATGCQGTWNPQQSTGSNTTTKLIITAGQRCDYLVFIPTEGDSWSFSIRTSQGVGPCTVHAEFTGGTVFAPVNCTAADAAWHIYKSNVNSTLHAGLQLISIGVDLAPGSQVQGDSFWLVKQ